MEIAVTGASGRAGSEITAELSRRGHAVTAIARHPKKIARFGPGMTAGPRVTCSTRPACPSFGPGMTPPSVPSTSGQRAA